MQKKIIDLEDITYSREMLEGKPHPFFLIFFIILITLISGVIIWMCIGKIDTVSKGFGQVSTNEKISIIQPQVAGKVKKVKFRNGRTVQKGQELITIESDEIDSKIKNFKKQMNKNIKEKRSLQKVILGIEQSDRSLLPHNSRYEKEYDLIGEQIKQIQLEFEQQKENLDYNKLEISNQINQKESNKSEVYTQNKKIKEELKNIINEISNTKTELKKLKKLKKIYERSAEEQRTTVKNETIPMITEKIKEQENLLNELQIKKASVENSLSSETTKSLDKEIINLEKKNGNLNTQKERIDSLKNISIKELKNTKINELNNKIDEKETKISEIKSEIELLEKQRKSFSIKSPINGFVDILQEVAVGNIVSPETPLFRIIPEEDMNKYIVNISLSESEISKIKLGDTVKYHFTSLPYQEHGELRGKIVNISNGAFEDKKGNFYRIQATIDNKSVQNIKKQGKELKVGMIAEAYVITDSKKIISHLLEKINLKE